MAHISKSKARLRIAGNELTPSKITELLSCQPSFSHAKNERIEINKTGNTRVTNFGLWSIDSIESEPENLDGQIAEIFEKLSSDLSIWESLNNEYKIDLFCGIFMKENMEGMSLSPKSLKILSDRGILLDLDIYGPDEENA